MTDGIACELIPDGWLDPSLPGELKDFVMEVRQYAQKRWNFNVPLMLALDDPELKEEVGAFVRGLGDRGWLSISWSSQFGGSGRSSIFEYALQQELAYQEAPLNHVALRIIAPVLMRHGTGGQQRAFLPRIASGEIEFAIGYSEPDAGTDLASLRTRAREFGQGWEIDGTKLWMSGAHKAEYCWLAARTGLDGVRGISLFVVPLDAPGVSVRPVYVMDGRRTNEVHFDRVEIRSEALVGRKHEGWNHIVESLALERMMAFPLGRAWRAFELLIGELSTKDLSDDALHIMGALFSRLRMTQLLSNDAAQVQQNESLDLRMASLIKVLSTEVQRDVATSAIRLLGMSGIEMAPYTPTTEEGYFEYYYQSTIMPLFGGGTNDILRSQIARLGLEL